MVELVVEAPILVAHRGYSGRYPENTLLSYQAAYQHGARYMELDLQLTADQVPMVHHDVSLLRMSGVDQDIRETKAKKVKSLRASYPKKFADDFTDNKFTSFKQYCKWLKKHPDVTTFVELKSESADSFGVPLFVDQVYRRILDTEVESQCVVIAFDHKILEYTREVSAMRIGYVLPEWSDEVQQITQVLSPDFVFCDTESLPEHNADVWQGGWQWAIYNLDDADSAKAMANRGFRFLETNQIGTLMQDSELANRS